MSRKTRRNATKNTAKRAKAAAARLDKSPTELDHAIWAHARKKARSSA